MNATPAFPASDPASDPAPDPNQPPEISSRLFKKIKDQIHDQGPMSFCQYMALALYDPDDGYYASTSVRVGKTGDFITSVSVGRCLGMILARRLHGFWKESGSGETFHIIELGAHDGSLCIDILTEAKQLDSLFFGAIHYHLVDAAPALIQAQQQKLNSIFPEKFTSHAKLNDLHNLHGAVISNELIDAFPVELIRFEQGQWWQLMVGIDSNDVLNLEPKEIKEPELKSFCLSLDNQFPDGYTTEFNPSISTFIHEVSHALSSGLFITIDYGHSTEDYYHPDRTTGTLQTYYKHQKAEDPFVAPGEIDITSHIDFTRLQSAAESKGFHSPSLRTQASYLTDHARSWLLDIENPDTRTDPETPNLLRQFQTLIHPAMLGTKFTVLEMSK